MVRGSAETSDSVWRGGTVFLRKYHLSPRRLREGDLEEVEEGMTAVTTRKKDLAG